MTQSINDWLQYQGFLTDKLRQSAGEANLCVLSETWRRFTAWEKATIAIPDELLFAREILMSAKFIPCWYARTLIPKSTYDAFSRLFARLNSEPLGHLIFNNPDVVRASFNVSSISPEHELYQVLKPQWLLDGAAFGLRVSIFVLKERYPFTLIEIYLPGLMRFIL